MRTSIFLTLLFFCLHGVCQTPPVFDVPNTNIRLQLPNDKWKASAETDPAQGVFFFKREPVKDAKGRSIIPAIMLFVEDAKPYKGDIVAFAVNKQASFQNRGAKMGKIQFGSGKDCPLSYPSGVLYKSSYTQEGVEHILYMIYLMDKQNRHAIQFYLDMTKDLGDRYEEELLATIRSVRGS